MYKTILFHADASRSAPKRMPLAALLAAQQGAHLICAAMTGISRYVYRQHEPLPHDVMRPDLAQLMTDRTQHILLDCDKMASSLGIQSYEKRLVHDDAFGGLEQQSRYADLVIVGQADRDDPGAGALMQDLPEYLVLNCVRPVLVVPFAATTAAIGECVLVAWDGSSEAARAITGALPILRMASRVAILMVDPIVGINEHREEPGADMALYLARHGVKVEVLSQAGDGDIGAVLLATADIVHADLLVMGAYGHPRFREILLGGATRTVLIKMRIPVLMSH